jgi:predicted RNase H-like nuclease
MLYMFRAVSSSIIRSSRTVHTASGMCQALLDATASVSEAERLTHSSGSIKQAWHIMDTVRTVLELLMMDGETARNM